MTTKDPILVNLMERPDLHGAVDSLVASNLPPFMMWASPGNWRWHSIYQEYPAHQVAALGPGGDLLGAANSVPLAWSGEATALPGGYDDVLVAATGAAAAPPSTLCLLSISLVHAVRGGDLARLLVLEMRRRARALGLASVIAPLRPTRKPRYPLVPMATYALWRTPSGDVFDPWLRTHVQLGATILGIAERSLVVSQPRARWEDVTGLPMPSAGAYLVDGALVPIDVNDKGIGVYAEPNIWVRHATGPLAREQDCNADR